MLKYISILAFVGCNANQSTIVRIQKDTAELPQPEEPAEEEVVDQPPTAVITGPDQIDQGEWVTLYGTESTDPEDGTLLNYKWQCGEELSSEEPTITIEALSENDIDCTLHVTDSSGQEGEATKTVRVEPIPAIWTFMVFINGDNNLEGAGIEDINEMEMAGSSDKVNILVHFDRSKEYDTSHGNWHGARRYRIVKDETDQIASPVLQDLGSSDSGDWRTVADFVDWSASNFPAQRYALVIWDHGWSWSATSNSPRKGISSDDETGNSISIANGDLEDILVSATDRIGKRLEVVGMDACIMGGWEIAHVSAPYGNYYVASQDYEGWDGWNYEDTMADLVANPNMRGDELGESIALRFYETGDLTQSTIDLGKLEDFETALNQVAQSMMASPEMSTYRQAVNRSYSYDGDWGVDRDALNLLLEMADRSNSEQLKSASATAANALSAAITSNYVNPEAVSGANGLSIYAPHPNQGYLEPSYSQSTWAQNSLWDDMLRVIFNQ